MLDPSGFLSPALAGACEALDIFFPVVVSISRFTRFTVRLGTSLCVELYSSCVLWASTWRACLLAVRKMWAYIVGMTTVGTTSNVVITMKAWTFFAVVLTYSDDENIQNRGEKEKSAGKTQEAVIAANIRVVVACDGYRKGKIIDI